MFQNIVEILKAKELLEKNGYIVSERILDGFYKCPDCEKTYSGIHQCPGKTSKISSEITYTYNDMKGNKD